MAGTVKHAKLDSRTARAKLKKGRQPHWQALTPRTHLGFQHWKGNGAGRWILRRYLGQGISPTGNKIDKYRVTPLGLADDYDDPNGVTILSFDQAKAKALSMVETSGDQKVQNLTVRQALERYIRFKESEGAPVWDVKSRGAVNILPELGDLVVAELTDDILRGWRNRMAASPAQNRPKAGKVQYRPKPEGDEAIRKRRSSANRTLNTLKAVLNLAFDQKQVNNRDSWGRRLKPFKDVNSPPVRYLTLAEAQRLYNSCDPEFQPLVRAALETGARYGELGRLVVADFNSDSGTLAIRKSKSGKARHIIVTDEGAAFFRQLCAGRAGSPLMLTHLDGKPWKKSDQIVPIREANERASITPRVSFHGLRHSWASLSVMAGVPLMIVAKNLGHVDTKMVERTYGHLSPDYTRDVIRERAPRYGIAVSKKVVPLR
jgi:integrase